MLMRLTPAERLASVRLPRIAVLSYAPRPGFGERLGDQMIHAVLPGAADVTASFGDLRSSRENLRPRDRRQRQQPVDPPISPTSCSRRSIAAPMLIGIFGTCTAPLHSARRRSTG